MTTEGTEPQTGAPHTSAIISASFCWETPPVLSTVPEASRTDVQDEAMAWQNLSQNGADAEHYALPSAWRRTMTVNGATVDVPKRGATIPSPNRLLEIHGLAGAIGEQLGLAWTAEQEGLLHE